MCHWRGKFGRSGMLDCRLVLNFNIVCHAAPPTPPHSVFFPDFAPLLSFTLSMKYAPAEITLVFLDQ